jgi:hypothetical protein
LPGLAVGQTTTAESYSKHKIFISGMVNYWRVFQAKCDDIIEKPLLNTGKLNPRTRGSVTLLWSTPLKTGSMSRESFGYGFLNADFEPNAFSIDLPRIEIKV